MRVLLAMSEQLGRAVVLDVLFGPVDVTMMGMIGLTLCTITLVDSLGESVVVDGCVVYGLLVVAVLFLLVLEAYTFNVVMLSVFGVGVASVVLIVELSFFVIIVYYTLTAVVSFLMIADDYIVVGIL